MAEQTTQEPWVDVSNPSEPTYLNQLRLFCLNWGGVVERERHDMTTDGVEFDSWSDEVSEQVKEVYARFGLAMYEAHCLERQLAIILATKYGPNPTTISETEHDNIFEALFSKTLGQLVSKVTAVAGLSSDEEQLLEKALDQRNRLAHRYFWERSIDFLSTSGRTSMLKELEEIVDSLRTVDQLFTNKTMEWAETFGITEQLVYQDLRRLARD